MYVCLSVLLSGLVIFFRARESRLSDWCLASNDDALSVGNV